MQALLAFVARFEGFLIVALLLVSDTRARRFSARRCIAVTISRRAIEFLIETPDLLVCFIRYSDVCGTRALLFFLLNLQSSAATLTDTFLNWDRPCIRLIRSRIVKRLHGLELVFGGQQLVLSCANQSLVGFVPLTPLPLSASSNGRL